MDLSSSYRSRARQHFPKAVIVADRFHVVRIRVSHFGQFARDLVAWLAAYKGHLGLLRKAPWKLSESERIRLKAVLEEHTAMKGIRHPMHYGRSRHLPSDGQESQFFKRHTSSQDYLRLL